MAKKSALLILSLFSSFAHACNEYDSGIDSSTNALMLHLAEETCVPLSDTRLYPMSLYPPETVTISHAPAEEKRDYWSDWVLRTEANPVLTQNVANNYFGIGWWSPSTNEDEQQDTKLTTEEWLMNHGLVFSVGFGDKKNGQPRLRLDYLWHDEYQDNLMMQIEVPF